MKLVLPGIHEIICIEEQKIQSVVIENQGLLYQIVLDLKKQMEKQEGKAVLSIHNEPIEIYKYMELVSDIYSVHLNSKTLLNKVTEALAQRAMDVSNYEETRKLSALLQNYINELAWQLDCEIECSDVTAKQLLKAVELSIVDDEESLSMRLLKYMELVQQFLGEKLFVFVNARAFILQEEFVQFAKTLIEHDYKVLFLDNHEYTMCDGENRYVVDIDLCEF